MPRLNYRQPAMDDIDYLLTVAGALGLSPVKVLGEITEHGAAVVAGLLVLIANRRVRGEVVH
jgi:hypothetical protein